MALTLQYIKNKQKRYRQKMAKACPKQGATRVFDIAPRIQDELPPIPFVPDATFEMLKSSDREESTAARRLIEAKLQGVFLSPPMLRGKLYGEGCRIWREYRDAKIKEFQEEQERKAKVDRRIMRDFYKQQKEDRKRLNGS